MDPGPALHYGSCSRCGESVHAAGGACWAMGRLFHNECFTCSVCNKQLSGKPFFAASGRIFCDDDFLSSGLGPPVDVCDGCGGSLTDLVLQARGKLFHPACFCCVVCRRELVDQPFAVDSHRRIYCVGDYHRVQAPRCGACRTPILPTEGSTESIRVQSANRFYHVECYSGEVDLL